MDDDEITIVHYNKNVRTKEPTPTLSTDTFFPLLTQIEIYYSFFTVMMKSIGEL